MEVECVTEGGFPPPNITWFINGEKVILKSLIRHNWYIIEIYLPCACSVYKQCKLKLHNALNGDQKWNLKKATKMQKLESKTIESTTLIWTYVQTFNLVI